MIYFAAILSISFEEKVTYERNPLAVISFARKKVLISRFLL